MSMRDLAAAFFRANEGFAPSLLTSRHNAAALDASPFGVTTRVVAAEDAPELLARYHAANARAFPPELALPGWVLGDLYVLPSAIGLLTARDDGAIVAAYVAVPSLEAGTFVGVSLLSTVPGRGAGAWIKALTLRAIGARRLRGVVQWASPSLRVHTRLGALRVIGPAPASHERAAESFVYAVDVSDDEALATAMARADSATTSADLVIRAEDHAARGAILERVRAGETVDVVPPGLDADGSVLLRVGGAP